MWLAEGRAGKRFSSLAGIEPPGTGGPRFDTRVYKLFEAFQSLEDRVFRLDARGSAAAYKRSTAHVLRRLGVIAAAETHPDCRDRRGEDRRPAWKRRCVGPRRVAEKLGIPWGS
jgi:hypothetical protein